MKAILDTNVLVSAALTQGGTCDRVLRAAFLGHFFLCTTDDILHEYIDVLSRPSLKLPSTFVIEIIKFLNNAALRFSDSGKIYDLPDPDDEILLAAALTSQADYLVTGNLKHFPPHLRCGVNVISPSEFLKHLPPT